MLNSQLEEPFESGVRPVGAGSVGKCGASTVEVDSAVLEGSSGCVTES